MWSWPDNDPIVVFGIFDVNDNRDFHDPSLLNLLALDSLIGYKLFFLVKHRKDSYLEHRILFGDNDFEWMEKRL